jgi:uncharacterized protein (TIGR02246 family)
VSAVDNVDLVNRLMDRYNAGDADGYADLMTEDAAEALYRGDVLREGREGVRSGLRAMFAEFPENKAVIKATHVVGDKVVLFEEVWRSPSAQPFDVVSIYSFAAGKVERVEFVR